MYLIFLLCQYKPIKFLTMKELILLVAVAISTAVSAQRVIIKDTFNLPNISVISHGYDITTTKWAYTGDSTFYPYAEDQLEYSHDSLGIDTTGWGIGVFQNDMIQYDSLLEHKNYIQTIFIDFDSYTITYSADDKYIVNQIVSVYLDPLANDPDKFMIWDENSDGTFNIYYIDFKNITLNSDILVAVEPYYGTLTFNVSQFIKF